MPRPSTPTSARGRTAPGSPPGLPTGLPPGLVAGLLAGLLAVLLLPPAAARADPRDPARTSQAGPAGRAPTGPAGPTGPTAGVATRAAAPATDLTVAVDEVSPGVLAEPGPVTVRGTVTNQTRDTWTDVALYATGPLSPITDAASLASAADSPADTYIGDRIVEPGTYATVEQLEPGRSATFELTVPAEQLGMTAAGVYLVGVHALGDSSVPRDLVADGRTRFFLPLVPEDTRPVRTAVIVPVRARVGRTPDGRVADLRRWTRSLRPGGRLAEVLTAGSEADATSTTWLVDPAVLDAVSSLAAGNPPLDLTSGDAVPDEEATPTEPGTTDPATEEPTEEQDGDDQPTEGADPDAEAAAQEAAAAQTAAEEWLRQLSSALAGRDVLALPYGDLDVSASATHDPAAYARARARAGEVMERLGIASTPVIASPDGYLSPDAVSGSGAETLVLAGRDAVVPAAPAPDSTVSVLGHTVAITSDGAGESTGEGTRRDPVAVRQRLVADAAIRSLADDPVPLVQALPATWSPEEGDGFLTSLDAPWLDVVPLREITSAPAPETSPEALVYPDEAAAEEVSATAFNANQDLLDTAGLLDGVLGAAGTLSQQVADDATTATSYFARDHPVRSVDQARAQEGHLAGLLSSVRVEAPEASTLSSASGRIGATVVNDLDQPVTVLVRTQTDGELQVPDSEPLALAPGARARLLLDATADRPGVHDVRLVVTDLEGRPLGSSSRISVRAAQVSGVIWVIIGAGLVMLFGAIGVRLVRRVRDARTEESGTEESGTEESAIHGSGAEGPGAVVDAAGARAGPARTQPRTPPEPAR